MTFDYQLRPVIFYSVLACLAAALAPWLTGGREPLAMLISAAALLLGLLLVWMQPEAPSLGSSLSNRVFFWLVGWGALSLVWTASRFSTYQWLYLWLSVPAAYYLAYVLACCRGGRAWLLRAYYFSAGLFSLYGLWLYITSPYDRLIGSFYWPNPAAAYLIPAVVIAAGRVGDKKKSWPWVTAAVIFGTTFALTDSRAATLVLAFLFIILLFKNRSRAYWVKIVFVIVAVVALSVGTVRLVSRYSPAAGSKTFSSRYSAAGIGASTSLGDRVKYLESAWQMTATRPILGFGAGTYKDVHPAYQSSVTDASADAHNAYVQTLAELGIVGLGILVLVLALQFFVVSETSFQSYYFPVILSAIGLTIHFGLDIDSAYPALLWLLAVHFAVLRPTSINKSSNKIVRLWPVALQAFVFLVAVAFYLGDNFALKAAAAQDDGDYPAAAELYSSATSVFIYNPDWLNSEGIDNLTAASMGDKAALDTALDLARRGEKEDRYDARQYQLEGRILQAEAKVKEAETAFKKAVSLDPNNRPDYYSDLTALLWSEGRDGQALAIANPFLAKYSDKIIANRSSDTSLKPALANLWGMVGQIYLESHNIANARNCAQQAVKIYPQSLRGRALTNRLNKQ